MSFEMKNWQNPPAKNRVNPIVHGWPESRTELMDAVKAFGFGGVVTNPSHENWYEGYRNNVREFKSVMKELDDRDLSYWIYDENGYPSGYAGGETLKGHLELEAKGFYMYRTITYFPRHTTYRIQDDTDKIVWAAKYPVETPGLHESFVQYDKMIPVPFHERYVECDMNAKEVLFVFAVRASYEGSQAVHNTCSFCRYINIMNPAAVRRFIDLCFEPIAEEIPDAFKRATAIFTDEPSLMVSYPRTYETWPYALAPWVDGLFEEYEKEYGESILPWLPLLFEGGEQGYPVRVNFYRLVGKLIARAYSGQLSDWCEAHGGVFSGHYLSEESMVAHVHAYGSYVEVVKRATYPGMDVLCCYPEIFNYNTVKHPQMITRKKNTDGMMVEICPFVDVPNFEKDPIENMSGIMGMLYMSGVRVTNSYFSSNFEEYDPEHLKGRTGYMHQDDAQKFNGFVGRMGYLLDGLTNDTHTFVYFGIEDASSKIVPRYTCMRDGPENAADRSTMAITRAIYEGGHDFYYADRDDLVDAANSGDKPVISGHPVETVIVPKLDVMYDDAYAALEALAARGVKVLFLDQVPSLGTSLPVERPERTGFTAVSAEEIQKYLDEHDSDFTVDAGGAMILKARFQKEGRELWMLDNNTRQPVDAVLNHVSKKTAKLYNPVDGSVTDIRMGDTIHIPSFRATFVWFD